MLQLRMKPDPIQLHAPSCKEDFQQYLAAVRKEAEAIQRDTNRKTVRHISDAQPIFYGGMCIVPCSKRLSTCLQFVERAVYRRNATCLNCKSERREKARKKRYEKAPKT